MRTKIFYLLTIVKFGIFLNAYASDNIKEEDEAQSPKYTYDASFFSPNIRPAAKAGLSPFRDFASSFSATGGFV